MKISERNGSQQCVLMNSSVHCWKNEGLPSCVGAPRHCFAGRPYGMLREGERLGSRTAKLASPWLWVTSVSWTSLVPPAAGLCPEWGISHSATLTALQSIACGASVGGDALYRVLRDPLGLSVKRLNNSGNFWEFIVESCTYE